MTEQDTPLSKPFATSFGGHFAADVQTREALDQFLDQAAVIYGPSGERATAEIGPADSNEIDLEFALFEDCAYLRYGGSVAVDPAFLDEDGQVTSQVERDLIKLINNPADEVETLHVDQLMCTPAWVRGVVIEYATTGHLPEDITWINAASTDEDR